VKPDAEVIPTGAMVIEGDNYEVLCRSTVFLDT